MSSYLVCIKMVIVSTLTELTVERISHELTPDFLLPVRYIIRINRRPDCHYPPKETKGQSTSYNGTNEHKCSLFYVTVIKLAKTYNNQ